MGTISFFRLSPTPSTSTETSPGGKYLQNLSVLRIPGLSEDDSFTYFTWHPEIPGLMAVTTSSGKVILACVQSDYKDLKRLRTVLSHDAEAWCVAFSPISYQEPSSEETLSTVFSGGDDFKMLLATHATCPDATEATGSDPEPAAPPSSESDSEETCIPPRDKKGIRHDAGVTAILPLRLTTSDGFGVVVTGSYSDHLSTWGILPPYKADGLGPSSRLLRRTNLGGGVWRLKVIEELSGYRADSWSVTLLVSCMHAGARVVRLEGSLGTVNDIKVLWRFEEHESMNYGSDYAWVDGREFFGEGRGKKIVCVSTSFYDKKLCLWTF
jgi:diphthamide biosynthesis protein 7